MLYKTREEFKRGPRCTERDVRKYKEKAFRLDPGEVSGELWAGIFHRVWGRSQQ